MSNSLMKLIIKNSVLDAAYLISSSDVTDHDEYFRTFLAELVSSRKTLVQ